MTSCQHKFVQEEYDSICELCGARENDVIEAADERRRRLNDITGSPPRTYGGVVMETLLPIGTPTSCGHASEEDGSVACGKSPVTETLWIMRAGERFSQTQAVFLCDLHVERSKKHHGELWERVDLKK